MRKTKLSHEERKQKKTEATSPQPASTTTWVHFPDFELSNRDLRHHWVKTIHPHYVLSKTIRRFWRNFLCSYSHWNTTKSKLNPMTTFLLDYLKCLTQRTKPSIFKYWFYFMCIPPHAIYTWYLYLSITPYQLPSKAPLPILFLRALS